MSAVPNYHALETAERATAFGLLCSARLLAVAAVGGFPCATDLGDLLRWWGDGGSDLASPIASLKSYSARFPYHDDIESPDYYRSLTVDLALMSIDQGEEGPADRARRLMFMATGAWSNLDHIITRCDAANRGLREQEVESQILDISMIVADVGVRPGYLASLERCRSEYQERARCLSEVSSLLGWGDMRRR